MSVPGPDAVGRDAAPGSETGPDDGLVRVYKTYAAVLDGRSLVVQGVPYLIDPDTNEEYLEPAVAEKLFDLAHRPKGKPKVIESSLYVWQEVESED